VQISPSFLGLAAATIVVAMGNTSCAPRQTLRPGCGKDTDCKGARVCVAHACIEPPAAKPTVIAAPEAPSAPLPPQPPVSPPLGPTTARAGSQFHGDAHHTGRYAGHLPASAPREVLRFATQGTIYGGIAVATQATGSTAFFGSHDRGLYAVALPPLDAPSSTTAATDAGAPLDGGTPDGSVAVAAETTPAAVAKWRRDLGDLVWATPALGPAVVYEGSDADALFAFGLEDGTLKWRFAVGPCKVKRRVGPEGSRCDVDGIAVGPDGSIYAAADGLYALRPDGTQRWKFSPGTTHCASAPAVADDGTVYVGCQDDALYAVGQDGLPRWTLRTGDDVDSSPAIGSDGTIYVGSDDRKLWAIGADGKQHFAVITGGAVHASPALGADGTIYVGSFDGQLYAVAPTGAVRWTYRSAGRIVSSPIVDADGAICFGSEDDRLYALEPDGKLRWSVQLDGDVDSTPTLLDDGTILVGSDDRALHVFRSTN
jgi:outer membrane protein assembly factor BamB